MWQAFGSNFCATSVASGSGDGETWAIHCGDNTIWHFSAAGTWQQPEPGAAGTKVMVVSTPDPNCGDHLPMVTGTGGDTSIYRYVHSGCSSGAFQYSNGGGVDISTDFTVGTDGRLYQWNATNSAWQIYATSPFGTNARIGTWSNGVYALSTADGTIQKVVPFVPIH
jgi:hypothetical protein